MRPHILISALALAFSAAAQTTTKPQPSPEPRTFPVPEAQTHSLTAPAVQLPTPFPSGHAGPECPVSLSVSRRGRPITFWTVSTQDASNPVFQRRARAGLTGSGLHVYISTGRLMQMPANILHAELAVDDLAPGARVVPVNAHNEPQTLSKTFTVRNGEVPGSALFADLLLGETGGIVRVRLLSIAFAGQQPWTAPNACTATPSLYVPVELAVH